MPIRRARRLAQARRRNPGPYSESLSKLLMQARKSADSSWGAKQWSEFLTALGFTVSIRKEGNAVVGMDITDQNGNKLSLRKRSGYRVMLFYEVREWTRKNGFDLPKMASAALEMPDPEEEKRLKKLYDRDLVNTGTCGVCEGNYKRDSGGGLVHHGYQRPGHGYIVGDCFGVGYQPWELSPKSVEKYLVRLDGLLRHWKEILADLPSHTFFDVVESKGYGSNRVKKTRRLTVDDEYRFLFDNEMDRRVSAAKRNVELIKSDIVTCSRKINQWKLDDLPEVKHPKR